MNKLIWLFFMILFVIGTDTFLISPLMPILQDLFHISTEVSGWMVGAYALGYALFALLAGPLSDGWDRKKVMLSGMIGFAVSTFLCGFAFDFWSMFVFRFLAGVSAAFTTPQVWASIPSVFPPSKIAKAMGITTAGLAVSQAFGVPLGSMLAVFHWSYPFYAIGLCALCLACWIWVSMPELKPNSSQSRTGFIFQRYIPLLRSVKARRIFLAYFLFQLGNFGAFAFIGKWWADRFHLPIDQMGYVMVFLGLGNLLGSLSSSYIIGKLNRFHAITIGISMLIAIFIAMPHLPTVLAAGGAYFFISFIFGIIFPLIMGLLLSLDPAIRGTISSLSNSVMYAATTLGAWTAGWLYALFNGYSAVVLFTAVCFAGSLLFFQLSGVLTIRRESQKDAASVN